MLDALRSGVLVWLSTAAAAVASAAPPTVLAPGVISGPAHDSAPAFTPDGMTVYFSRGIGMVSTILVSHKTPSGDWSPPVIAPFSGEWSDMEPAMAPDGSYLVFVSNRPARAGGVALDGAWNGKSYPTGGGNLWRVDRKGDSWATPVRLPDIINRTTSTFSPAVTRDGSLYFMEPAADGKFGLHRAQRKGSTFAAPVPVPFGHAGTSDVDLAIAPDESYAVFGSGRGGNMDLYFVRRTNGVWGTPTSLGDEVNSPSSDTEARLSPDGKTLYFSSERTVPVKLPRTRAAADLDLARSSWDNGLYNIWQVDLTPWIEGKK